MLANTVLLLAFATRAFSSPAALRSTYAVKDTHSVPAVWTNEGHAPAAHLINLQIGLKQGRFSELEQHLHQASDPSSPKYGAHLSESQVQEFVKPSSDSLKAVHEWLESHGLDLSHIKYSAAKDWIKISLPVERVERLLDTKYSVYRHNDDGSRLVRTPEWSLPLELHEHIDAVQPTNSFLRAMPKSRGLKLVMETDGSPMISEQAMVPTMSNTMSNPTVEQACNFSAVTPTCLRTLYGTYNYKVNSPFSKVGLNDFLGETNNRSDTKLFLQKYRPEAAGAADTFKFDVINGGNTNQAPLTPAGLAAGTELEGNLDSETILGIAYPIPLTAYTTGGSPPYKPDAFEPTDENEPYLDWLNYILAQPQSELPQTISTSYADDEQTVPLSYATTVCQHLAQLSARGVSLFFGSGDEGVGSAGTCISNNGTNAPSFIASFPSTCPYITSVGGTKNNPPVAAYDARNGFASGGGFSNYFGRPQYQDAAQNAYINGLGAEFAGLYNRSGRGYPDVSAQSQSFITIWDGHQVLLDGTSASTPTVAAVFALLNDALLSAGRPPLGLINPWLYSIGQYGFTDVVSGSAIGCNTTGFECSQGWDPVTGFGTPNFPKLMKLLGLPPSF